MLSVVCYITVLDFFESDDQDSDLGPQQNVLQLESQHKWEVSMYYNVSRYISPY